MGASANDKATEWQEGGRWRSSRCKGLFGEHVCGVTECRSSSDALGTWHRLGWDEESVLLIHSEFMV